MAETEGRQQNQAFLQQMERQRRQKICQRNIDLRGKVPGECQAYEIGGLTHYLDDRAYTLIKQLMERNTGQYTVGVYEGLLEGMKRLKALSAIETETIAPPSEDHSPALIRLDQAIRRREIRIQLVTPLHLQIGDLSYHASSVDLTSSAVRVTMKRTFTLNQDDVVNVTFSDLLTQAPADLLVDLPYRIVRLQHTEKYSFAVLGYCGQEDPALMTWWHSWLQQRNAAIDSANELFNLAQQFYLRLFCRSLASPLLWLAQHTANTAVEVSHLLPAAENTLALISQPSGKVSLPTVSEQATGAVTVVDHQLQTHDLSNLDAAQPSLQSLTENQSLLLYQHQAVAIDTKHFSSEIDVIRAIDSEAADTLTAHLAAIKSLFSLTDVSAILDQNPATPTKNQPSAGHDQQQITLPPPETLRHYIRRGDDRLVIRTPITLQVEGNQFDLTTNEVSVNGLSVRLPANAEVTNGMRVTLHFHRWQQQSPKLALDAVPYHIRNVQCWSNGTDLGLQRVIEHCSAEVNTYFRNTINENRAKLAMCYDDVLLSQKSRIFSGLLSKYWQNIPLFFGMDDQQRRILQAVGLTEQNLDSSDADFWLALNARAGRLTTEIKPQLSDERDIETFGLYAYQQQHQEWVITTDAEFEDAAAKRFFILKALQAPRQHFFHCHLVPLKSGCVQEEQDLLAQLNNIPKNHIHKVRNLRSDLFNIFAVGHLTDVRQLIKAVYLN